MLRLVEQMPQFVALRAQIVFRSSVGSDDCWHSLYYANPSGFERLDLFRIIRHRTHLGNSEVFEDGTGQGVAAEIRIETELLVRFHGIGALILKLVSAQLVE